MKLHRGLVSAWFAAIVILSNVAVQADVRLPKIFGDHMVVQQKQPLPVWGWAEPGEKVTVRLAKSEASATADGQGKWSLKLDAIEAGGPCEMTVQGKNTLVIKDILIGEVWIGSGQSNMEWPVVASNNGQQEVATADYPQIRLFTVRKKVADKPQDDCEGAWSVCSPKTVPGFSAAAYFFGRQLHKELHVPVGLINSSWGGTLCEAWTSREDLEGDEDFKPILQRAEKFQANNPNQAAVLYNGMINPVVPFAIRGAIWYQGESNVSRAVQYQKLFPAMIRDWRKHWNQGDFQFLYVQLAPFRYGGQDPRNCAELWEAQRLTLAVPNTGMAVVTDIGNVRDIHPKNKQEAARRLALWALAKTYGKDLVYSGPLYDSMAVEGNKVRVKFTCVGGGLKSRDDKPLSHFMIAGEDGNFVPATATVDGASVIVEAAQVAKPVAVRFAWSDTAEPNLMNAEGLPASPFRTDSFPLGTASNK
jgi:sialate O-acetylesterase